MQNIVKTVIVLPNLPTDLDIILVHLLDTAQNPKYIFTQFAFTDCTDLYRYQRQFKVDF